MRNVMAALVLALVSGGCASYTANQDGHTIRGLSVHGARDAVLLSEAEVNSGQADVLRAQAYTVRETTDMVVRAAERGDIIPVPSYGLGMGGGWEAEYFGYNSLAHPGYMIRGGVDPSLEGRVGELETTVESHGQVLGAIENIMRQEAAGGGQ